jgi:hypothetical protein
VRDLTLSETDSHNAPSDGKPHCLTAITAAPRLHRATGAMASTSSKTEGTSQDLSPLLISTQLELTLIIFRNP